MAKRGVFHALGNLWRWTIWGLAAVLVVALWLGWSEQANGPDGTVDMADGGAVDEGTEVGNLDVTVEDTDAGAEEETAEAGEPEAAVADAVEPETGDAAVAEDVSAPEAEVAAESGAGAAPEETAGGEDAVVGVVDTLTGAVEDVIQTPAEEAAEEARAEAESAGNGAEASAESDVQPAAEGAVPDADAVLNIVPPELSEIRVPGDDATYSLISVFRRDNGMIEVVTERTLEGETTETVRLVTCAPLAVGVIAEGDGPRNETPELERIPLGSAAATIAAVACGAMN